MILTPNTRSERAAAVCAKTTACLLLSVLATTFLYFAFENLADLLNALTAAATFSLLLSLALSWVMLLFLYGAAKTSVKDYAIQIRILRMHGFRGARHMTAEEFDRLAAIERSIDEEILERTKEQEMQR
jgi:uncharacterized membrane protein